MQYLIKAAETGLSVKILEQKKHEIASLIISSQSGMNWNNYNNTLQTKISNIYEKMIGYRLFVTSRRTKIKKHIMICGLLDGTLKDPPYDHS